MNNYQLKLMVITSLALFLVGCGSSPRDSFYLLNAAEHPAAVGSSPSLGIGPVKIPEYLSRENMVFARQKNTLDVADSQKWAEPLEDGVKRVLALNLSAMANTQDVRFYPWHAKRPPIYGVEVNIMSLDATAEGANMTTEWLLYTADGAPLTRRISRLNQPIQTPGNGQNIAAAYSLMLEQLSELIAAAIAVEMRRAENAPALPSGSAAPK